MRINAYVADVVSRGADGPSGAIFAAVIRDGSSCWRVWWEGIAARLLVAFSPR
jgi:hypothetical protein